MINVALGGTLYQDLPSERPGDVVHKQTEPKNAFSHSVNLLADTPLHRLVGVERMRANSFHHQAVKHLGKGAVISAITENGVVEGIELPQTLHPFFLGVQWHPEHFYREHPAASALFSGFIDACKQRIEKRG